MKQTLAFAVALLLAACGTPVAPTLAPVETYVLERIDGIASNGRPIVAVGGELRIEDGRYTQTVRTSMAPGDTGTIFDRGSASEHAGLLVLSSDRDWHQQTGTRTAGALSLRAGSWDYHWRASNRRTR